MQPIRRHGPVALTAYVLVAFALVMAAPHTARAEQVSVSSLRVCIDAGHGGIYSGATYAGVQEADINLGIAKRLASELRRRGIDARLTRSSDTRVYAGGALRTWRFDETAGIYSYRYWPVEDASDRLSLDLQARADAANASGADLFVSIHNNAAGSSAHGAEVWRSQNDPLGQRFGLDVQNGLIDATSATNRGVQTANFYVLRWSNVPAVLAECGFISNSGERARLRTASYQNTVARGIADGIQAFASRPVNEPYQRIWGQTRYDTASAVSVRQWPTGAAAVVLVSGEDFPDALVAAPLAAKLGAPIITTARSGLAPSVAAELRRLAPRRIVVIGGEVSVPPEVAEQAALAAGIASSTVERLGGQNRYEVSLAVARAVESSTTTSVVIASGTGFADALSVAASAAQRGEPILLAGPEGLSAGELEFIDGETTRAVTVVGGPMSIPSEAMSGRPFSRLWGANRYETNWAVFTARYAEAARRRPVLVSGETFADALVAGPSAAAQGRPMVLVGRTQVSQDLRPWVYGTRNATLDVDVVGGPASVSAYVSAMFEKMEMRSY